MYLLYFPFQTLSGDQRQVASQQAPASDMPNQPPLIIYIIMSPYRGRNANGRPAPPLLALFAKHTLLMNKARLQTIDRCWASSSSHYEHPATGRRPGSLLICCKSTPYVLSLLFFLQMNDCKHSTGGKNWGRKE